MSKKFTNGQLVIITGNGTARKRLFRKRRTMHGFDIGQVVTIDDAQPLGTESVICRGEINNTQVWQFVYRGHIKPFMP